MNEKYNKGDILIDKHNIEVEVIEVLEEDLIIKNPTYPMGNQRWSYKAIESRFIKKHKEVEREQTWQPKTTRRY